MVADDQALVRTGFRTTPTADGIYVVADAANGVEAVDAVHRTRPDVVLMNIRMPEPTAWRPPAAFWATAPTAHRRPE